MSVSRRATAETSVLALSRQRYRRLLAGGTIAAGVDERARRISQSYLEEDNKRHQQLMGQRSGGIMM